MQIDGTNARRKRLVPKTRSERTNNLRGSESHYQAHDREQINRIRAHETKTAHDRMQRVRPLVRPVPRNWPNKESVGQQIHFCDGIHRSHICDH